MLFLQHIKSLSMPTNRTRNRTRNRGEKDGNSSTEDSPEIKKSRTDFQVVTVAASSTVGDFEDISSDEENDDFAGQEMQQVGPVGFPGLGGPFPAPGPPVAAAPALVPKDREAFERMSEADRAYRWYVSRGQPWRSLGQWTAGQRCPQQRWFT